MDYAGLRVRDMKEDMGKSDLFKAFSDVNMEICKAKIFRDVKTQKRNGCVQFKSHEEAKKALEMGTIRVGEEDLLLTSCCRCRINDDATPYSMCPPTIISNDNSNSNGNDNSNCNNSSPSTARFDSIQPSSNFNSMADSMCPATDAATVSTAPYSMSDRGREAEESGNTLPVIPNGGETATACLPPTDDNGCAKGDGEGSAKSKKNFSFEVPGDGTVADNVLGTNKTDGNCADDKKKGKKAKKKNGQEKNKNGNGNGKSANGKSAKANNPNGDNGKTCNSRKKTEKKKGKKQDEKLQAQAFETTETHKNGKRSGAKVAQKKTPSGENNRCCKKAAVHTYSDGEDQKPHKYSLKNRQA